MNSMEISNYLEKIRYGRKITQEDFVDGVVSLRQYQRYRSGECEITYEKIEQFAAKLGIPAKKLMNEFERDKMTQSKLIDQFYNAVVNQDKTQISEYEAKLDEDMIFGDERKLYFRHSVILNLFLSGKISKVEAIRKSSTQIDYPAILKKNYYTDIEMLILSFLLSVLEGQDRDKLLKKITWIFESAENIMSGGNDLVYPLILMRVAKIHGIQRNYVKVVAFCNMGINRGVLYKQYYLMDYFYYFKALAHFNLEQYELYEEALFRCYSVLHLEGNRKKIEKFTKLIESDFQIVYDTFILKFLQKKIV